ncbi:MAG: tandem-95 repeat protein, partial [Candidatus Poribacteria bacterium]|nr:tandem-95 repeat protein [Candidatus Poribacteria bacterium]
MIYTPNQDYNGEDSFTYKTNDGTVDSPEVAVNLAITSVNDVPVVVAQEQISTLEDIPVEIDLVVTDADKDSLIYTVVSSPAQGVLSGEAPALIYTPNQDYNGEDSFTYKANDGTVDSLEATVNLTVTPVNDAAVASEQVLATTEDKALDIILGGTDVEGDLLTYMVVTPPTQGRLSGEGPNLVYTPNLDFNGIDNFTFKANDGTVDSSAVTLNVTVASVNDPPVASKQVISTAEDSAIDIILSAKDVDSDNLAYIIISSPKKGVLSGTGSRRKYTPNLNFNGSDSFTFKVNDGTADSIEATVSLTVTSVNDRSSAKSQNLITLEDSQIDVTLAGTDVDEGEQEKLSYEVVTPPTNGALSGKAPNLVYTPNQDYNGSDSFTFKANDGIADGTEAIVTLTVTSIQDVPVAAAQKVEMEEDTVVNIVLTGTDVDEGEQEKLSYEVVTSPTKGVLSGEAPNLVYTPNANFNGSDSFTFQVNDGTADSTEAIVTLTVAPIQDAPVVTTQKV